MISPSTTTLPPNNRSRVKLYTLNEERQWDDRGTGFVACTTPTAPNTTHALIVKSEVDGSTLLDSKILLNTKYQKQQETLIVWSEGDKHDLALSFQEKAGCDDIWENICDVQGKDSSPFLTTANSLTSDSNGSTAYDSDDECVGESNDNYLPPTIILPPVDLSHLHDICDLFSPDKVRDASRRDLLARAIESGNYIRKLIDLFHICEDLENLESLHQLYEIIRSMFYLNKSSLFQLLFSEEYILDVIGCLEYDSQLNYHEKRNHREFLDTKATFREVIPIINQELLSKIHQTYRVQYIQDAILPAPSLFEENLLSTMNSFLFFNKVDIVTLLYEDPKFLSQLFSTLKDENLSDEKRKDLMLFLKEFCVFSQTLQQQNRDNFFQALATHGILNVIQVMLSLDDVTTKQAALDVFASIVECNPSTVREYMLQETQSTQDDDELLLNLVISEIQSDPDPELSGALNLMNYLKLLIDPENMMAVVISEKTEFLSFFYFRSMSVLLAPLMANTSDLRLTRDDFHIGQLQNLILDFVTFCIEHHTYHMRNFLNKKDLLRRVLVLLKSKHQFLQLSALRFLRKIVGLKDEQYNLAIVRNNYFAPIVDSFKANKRRYNLLNSALIELFEFIRHEDVKILINYFVENFYSEFESVNYVKTFHDLKIRYEAHRDRRERMLSDSSPIGSSRLHDNLNNSHLLPMQHFNRTQRHRKDDRDLDAEEENWFNDDGDENRISLVNRSTVYNGGSDDEDSQPETSGTTSAISTNEPIRSHHFRADHDEDGMVMTTAGKKTRASRSQYNKPVISIHIRRSPISSVGQLPPSSSTSAENDPPAALRVDVPSTTTNGSSSSSSPRSNEPTSTYAMSPGLSNIADQYNDDENEQEEDIEKDVFIKSNELNTNGNNSDSCSSTTRKRKIEHDDDDDDDDDDDNNNDNDDHVSSSVPNDDNASLLHDNNNTEQNKVFKRSNDGSTK
ncbi:unnamed protein product [Rotaria magnacalcarata]|uniref:Serine/threonine-protein phosphatase 4 regulatory subunit 3-like central domain-containing protein n=3 Tax=Rotaria magnacalcarata TaxID=392030 RepID=A0A819I777_9BILA|nr:unnamed protein product [Rotaria magnacalcarata]CAF2097190.1 unnamed protein product [Rotaria magnacalcarata]CAF3914255.1 unnamed protein product [Rotaria magnacalcarata]